MILDEELERTLGGVSLLTPEAFTYYLPAFLSYGTRRNPLIDPVVVSLVAAARDATAHDFWRERIIRLCGQQAKLLLLYLEAAKDSAIWPDPAEEASVWCQRIIGDQMPAPCLAASVPET